MGSDSIYHDGMRQLQDARETRPIADRLGKVTVRSALTDDDRAFIERAAMCFIATADAEGRPDCSYKGGLPGFVRVLDERTLGFADFKGNRQYITTGNLAENAKAFMFIMDYARQRRVKIWGRARVVEDDEELLARLRPEGYPARPEQAILFDIEAWDTNCPQHIPQMFHAEDVARAIEQFQARIRELEAEVAALKGSR
jgi:predicted pyridoxine 5'-phosphate oxidase superfamily flavin-nucleotide-binding protein